jgi:hypothetical protein
MPQPIKHPSIQNNMRRANQIGDRSAMQDDDARKQSDPQTGTSTQASWKKERPATRQVRPLS